MRGRTLGGSLNLFLQLKVSDENNFKIESIDISSFKMQFLSRVAIKLKFGRMLDSLVVHMTQFDKKIDTILNMASRNLLFC